MASDNKVLLDQVLQKLQSLSSRLVSPTAPPSSWALTHILDRLQECEHALDAPNNLSRSRVASTTSTGSVPVDEDFKPSPRIKRLMTVEDAPDYNSIIETTLEQVKINKIIIKFFKK
jgi:hypothetical protein